MRKLFLILLLISSPAFAVDDGTDNIRYLFMDTTKLSYGGMITALQNMHKAKEEGNTLTVIYRLDGLQSLVKVVGHVGWLEDFNDFLNGGIANGSIISINTYNNLSQVTEILATTEWNAQ